MKKCSNNNQQKYILSDNALLFIKKYAIPALGINTPIDDDIEFQILAFAEQCELNMIDESGNDRREDYPEKERDILGDAYVTEVSALDNDINLIDLNSRLELI